MHSGWFVCRNVTAANDYDVDGLMHSSNQKALARQNGHSSSSYNFLTPVILSATTNQQKMPVHANRRADIRQPKVQEADPEYLVTLPKELRKTIIYYVSVPEDLKNLTLTCKCLEPTASGRLFLKNTVDLPAWNPRPHTIWDPKH